MDTPEAHEPTPKLRKNRTLRRVLAVLSVPFAVGAVFVAFTLGPALVAPGTDSVPARVAEWARDYGMGSLVTGAEQVVYEINKPKEGGTPQGGLPQVAEVDDTTPAAVKPLIASASGTPIADNSPDPIKPQLTPALKDEGQWQTLLTSNGRIVARAAFLRPDDTHTSYSVGVVWMDASALSFSLHQGTQVPGGKSVAPSSLTASEQKTVLATFNSGFMMKDARGGYWQNGHSFAPLVNGAASMVFTEDGRLTVKRWTEGTTPKGGIVAVRQNLKLLVDNGHITREVANASTTSEWGATVGNKAFVWRTALGVRADGSLLFVIGPAMDVASLAAIAHDAGAVEAMELDINKDWTSFITYSQPGAKPTALTSDEVPNPRRYLTTSTRDFISVLPR